MKFGKPFIFLLILALFALSALSYLSAQQRPPKTWPEALEHYLGTPAYKTVDRSKPIDTQTSVFETAGRTFEMPTVYIDSNLGGKREQPEGVLLIYVLPEYKSRADFANREEYQRTRKAGHFGFMLIEPEAVRPSFDVMVENRHRSVTKVESAGTFDGLEVEKWYRPDGDKLEHVSDVYLEKDSSGRILSFIDCDTSESAVVPGCNHKFRDNHLLYSIHYRRANYLASWRTQRTSAIAFIDSFQLTKPY